jgi:hypothetical protein
MASCLPPGFAFAEVQGGRVTRRDRSPGTTSLDIPLNESDFSTIFQWAEPPSSINIGSSKFYWWNLNLCETHQHTPGANWRTLLSAIAIDITGGDGKKFKDSICGIIAAANSYAKIAEIKCGQPRTELTLFNLCKQRFLIKSEKEEIFTQLLNHPQFNDFLAARVQAFI